MTDDTLKARLQHDLHDAMRARDTVRSGTLRMTLTAITNAEVAGDEARELSDDEVLKVVAKEAKKRKEAAAAFTGAGRPGFSQPPRRPSLLVLEGYLPAQLDDEALREIVDRGRSPPPAPPMPQLGMVMKAPRARSLAGQTAAGWLPW